MALRADDVDLSRDRLLVEQFQAGDVAGFEDLYRRYYTRLYRFCLKRVGDTAEAEEVTQEAFTRAYTAMPRLAGERKFYPWLSVIAARLCLDTHRRRARSVPLPELDLGGVDGDQEKVVLQAADRELLRAAMDRLGPRHREVLQLREQEGWAYQRIAEHYGVSLGTVEQLLWRARRALRREFESVAGPDARALAGLPVIGWLARRMDAVRARLTGWSEQAAPLAGNAVSMLMVVTTAAVMVAGGQGHTAPSAPVRATARPAAAVSPAPAAPAGAVPVAPSTASPSSSPAAPVPAATPAPTGPMHQMGPLLVGSDAQARQESADHPVKVEVGQSGGALSPWISADPKHLLPPVISKLGGVK
jgi:RNA polymerase sigma-70 factor (ECF subfamily)